MCGVRERTTWPQKTQTVPPRRPPARSASTQRRESRRGTRHSPRPEPEPRTPRQSPHERAVSTPAKGVGNPLAEVRIALRELRWPQEHLSANREHDVLRLFQRRSRIRPDRVWTFWRHNAANLTCIPTNCRPKMSVAVRETSFATRRPPEKPVA